MKLEGETDELSKTLKEGLEMEVSIGVKCPKCNHEWEETQDVEVVGIRNEGSD